LLAAGSLAAGSLAAARVSGATSIRASGPGWNRAAQLIAPAVTMPAAHQNAVV
jgi:hypothetical protein